MAQQFPGQRPEGWQPPPGTGAPRRNGCLLWAGAFAAILVVLWLVGAVQEKEDQEVREAVAAGATAADGRAPIDLTPAQLRARWDANEVAASEFFKEKRVRVAGTISAIGVDVTGAPYLSLDDGPGLLSVNSYLPRSAAPDVAQMAKGQRAQVVCDKVSQALTVIVLGDCALVK